MAALALPICTRTLLQTARLSTPIVTIRPQHIRRRITHIRLREASHKSIRHIPTPLHALLKQVCRNPLIIPGHMRVVFQHTRPMHRKPGQHAHILEIARPPKPQQGKLLVHTIGIPCPLLRRISEISVQTPTQIRIRDIHRPDIEIPRRQTLVRPLDAQHRPVDDSLVTLLIEPETRDLRKQVVKPGSRPGVAMRPRDSNVRSAIHGVIRPQRLQPLQNPVPDRRVPGLRVEDEVHESVAGVIRVAHDKSPRVQPLP
jgi:hypothetical protein